MEDWLVERWCRGFEVEKRGMLYKADRLSVKCHVWEDGLRVGLCKVWKEMGIGGGIGGGAR